MAVWVQLYDSLCITYSQVGSLVCFSLDILPQECVAIKALHALLPTSCLRLH